MFFKDICKAQYAREVYDDCEPKQGVINGIFKSLEDPCILDWRAFSNKNLKSCRGWFLGQLYGQYGKRDRRAKKYKKRKLWF